MPPLSPKMMQGRWMHWWLSLSFAVMFCSPFLFTSRIGLLNVVDVLFFLPSLTLITRAVVSGDHRIITAPIMLPLYLFLGWCLLSLNWAQEANSSRVVRGVVQIVILVGMLRWLHLYFRHTLKRALANGALCAVAVGCGLIVSYYTTQPLTSPLFSEPANLIFRLPVLDPALALMAMTTPVFILLAQGLEEGATGKGSRRMFGAIIGLAFMTLVSHGIGLMAVLLAFAWLALRRKLHVIAAIPAVGAVALMLTQGHDTPLALYFQHPVIGNGLNQESLNGLLMLTDQGQHPIAHPRNLLLVAVHSVGLIGLLLFLCLWLVPLIVTLRTSKDRHDSPYRISVVPGFMMCIVSGAFLLTPFHPSWMALWLPLALLLAQCRDNPLPSAFSAPTTGQGRTH